LAEEFYATVLCRIRDFESTIVLILTLANIYSRGCFFYKFETFSMPLFQARGFEMK
jgi:hypothetical protein